MAVEYASVATIVPVTGPGGTASSGIVPAQTVPVKVRFTDCPPTVATTL